MNEPVLSDFDALAIDEESRPCTAVTAASPCGVVLEIDRDLLCVRDGRAWRQGAHAPCPVVATLQSGRLCYLDAYALAGRGPQDGVYAACWFNEPSGLRLMAAVGCRGWQSGGSAPGGREYVGVLPSSVAHLESFLAAHAADLPGGFARLDFSAALRVNQGDRFLAAGAGFAVDATPPGQAGLPLLYVKVNSGAANP